MFYHYHRNREQAYGANHDERATIGTTRGSLSQRPCPRQPLSPYSLCLRDGLSTTVCVLSWAGASPNGGGSAGLLQHPPPFASRHQSTQTSRRGTVPHLGAS